MLELISGIIQHANIHNFLEESMHFEPVLFLGSVWGQDKNELVQLWVEVGTELVHVCGGRNGNTHGWRMRMYI